MSGVVQCEFTAKCRLGVFVAAEFALGHPEPVEHFDQIFRIGTGLAFHAGERWREVFERAGEFAMLVGALAVGEQVAPAARGGRHFGWAGFVLRCRRSAGIECRSVLRSAA